jgi:hypothetical protein
MLMVKPGILSELITYGTAAALSRLPQLNY